MKNSNLNFAVVAALAGVLGASEVSFGQYRVGSDGRANDASNRIGSGGLNSDPPGTVRTPVVTGNQIVTGNVTGGREFRGDPGYTDSRAFRGGTADETSDRFIRGSSGVPINGVNNNNASNVQSFYGSGRAVPPPPGFQQQGVTGAYVPAPPLSRTNGDLRLGDVIDTPQNLLPPPGDLLLPGPVDPSTGGTMISASPLYGIRQWRAGVPAEQATVDRFSQDRRPSSPDRNPLDQTAIDQYQTELRDNPVDAPVPGDALPTGTDLNAPKDAAVDPNLSSNALPERRLQNDALGSPVGSDQSTRQAFNVPPAKQSALYAQLQRQFDQQGAAATDEEAQRRFALQRKLQANATKQGAMPLQPGLGGQPTEANPGDNQNPPADGAVPPAEDVTARLPMDVAPESPQKAAPVRVDSLATGVKAKGLADLLTAAEAKMRAGEFGAALDSYDDAGRVAPNNPLITLGRAHAQLGASYYGRAEADLRGAFTQGPALLAGRYDLKTFFGAERLQFLIKDLKEIASAEPQQPGPTFLLAYIAYNMENADRAADYLSETEKRLGGSDPLISRMRTAWQLGAPQELNK